MVAVKGDGADSEVGAPKVDGEKGSLPLSAAPSPWWQS